MVTNLSSGIITFLFNLLMMHYAGEDGVAAITIIQYSQFLLNALYMDFRRSLTCNQLQLRKPQHETVKTGI